MSRWTAPTQRMSIIWYFITPKLFFVCVCVSQLFLVNPDQLVCQKRVTDTVDLKAISRPAVCNSLLFSHLFYCVFPLPFSRLLCYTALLSFFLSFFHFPFLTSITHMTPALLFDTVLTAFLCVPNPGFMTHFVHFPACLLHRLNHELLLKCIVIDAPPSNKITRQLQLFKLLNTSDVCSWPVNKLLYS